MPLKDGAWSGVEVWGAYALLESWFAVILPWLMSPPGTYEPPNRVLSLAVFALYPLIGAILGSRIAALLMFFRKGNGLTRRVSLLVLVILFTANFALRASGGSRLLLGVWIGLILMLAWGRFRLVSDPWFVAALLAGLPWLRTEILGRQAGSVHLAAFAVYAGAAVGLSFVMRRQSMAALLVLVTAGLGFAARGRPVVNAGTTKAAMVPKASPNVVLVTMSGVRADYVSLNKLVKQSVVYKQAVSTADASLPSHASLFTGLYPASHGARFGFVRPWGSPLDEKFYTLAEALRDNGYRTAAVVADRGYLKGTFGLNQGFTHYDDRGPVPVVSEPKHYLRSVVGEFLCKGGLLPKCDVSYRTAAEINGEVMALLPVLQASGPFFLFLNYMDVYLSSDYEKAVADMERQLDALVDLDNTLLIVTSDHGEAFGERNLTGHGVSVYQDQVHVPLIVRYPGSRITGRSDEVVSAVDVMPTVLSTLGLPVPADVQGVSLAGESNQLRERDVISETCGSGELMRRDERFQRIQRALRQGRWKLVRYERARELYDLVSDPYETTNLCAEERETCARMEERLDQWVRANLIPEWTAPRPSDAEIERLRHIRGRRVSAYLQ